MLSKSLITICDKKINKKIEKSWQQIAYDFNYPGNGESLRCCYKRHRKKNKTLNNIETRILCISDLHVPFNNDINVLSKYKDKVDILVLNGDITDCQSLSKFTKKYRISFLDELILTRQLIIDLDRIIKPKKIVLNHGNHEVRLINYFSTKIHEDLLELMPNTSMDLIVDQGFYKNNHKNRSKVKYNPLSDILNIKYSKEWFSRIGKTIFCHPSAYRQGILGTTEKTWQYMHQEGYIFDCLVVAHTHQVGFCRYGKTYIYEQGCFCKTQEYAKNGKLTRPQNNGYLYLCQDKDGNIIYDKTKLEIGG